MTSVYVPERGDIVWLNLNPQAGHEQSSRRPALVISPREYNKKTGLAIFIPCTAQIKGYPFEVIIPDRLKVKGAILSDQLKSLDWKKRKATYVCKLPENELLEVLRKLNTLIK